MKYKTDDPNILRIIDKLKDKTDKELLKIYKNREDLSQHSLNNCEAAKLLLKSRRVSIPKLDEENLLKNWKKWEKREKRINKWMKKNLKFWIPKYDEMTLFIISISFLFFLFVSESFQSALKEFFLWNMFVSTSIFIGIFFGIIISVYQVFSYSDKIDAEKSLMLYFAVIVSGLVGLQAGFYVLKESKGIFIIFPIWNIIYSLLLLILYQEEFIDIDAISDAQARPLQIILGTVFAMTILYVCHNMLEFHWTITFSIVVGYATTLNHLMEKLFIKKGIPK